MYEHMNWVRDEMGTVVDQLTQKDTGALKRRQLCIQMDEITRTHSNYTLFVNWLDNYLNLFYFSTN